MTAVDGFPRHRSPLGFATDFERDVDRATFCFILTDDQRKRWGQTGGAHPRTTPAMAALIAAGLR